MMKREGLEKSLLLLRKELGSVDFFDIDKIKGREISNEEFLARSSAAESFWSHYFRDIIKLKIQEQLEEIAKSENIDNLLFGRGTLNGIYLIEEWFNEQIGISVSKSELPYKSVPGDDFSL